MYFSPGKNKRDQSARQGYVNKESFQYEQEKLHYGNRVAFVTILINVALTLFKLLAGILGHSMAMLSDAVHSASDVFITFFVLIGLKLAHKNPDEQHPYGHEKMESLISIVMSLILAIVAFSIGYNAVLRLINQTTHAIPGSLALIAAVISIAVKEWMYHYTKRAARYINSSTLEADAWHHRADAFSSMGSLIGIGGAMLGLSIMDPLAACVICLLILRVAVNLIIKALNQLVDKAAPPEIVKHLEELIITEKGIIRMDDLKTRQHGAKLFVDVEICVDGDLSLTEAHKIAESLHNKIEADNSAIKHCMIHVNPAE
ncbi:MAG: cation diffusion facilitator family transporter [Firmicutes bacterium]|nr:cation diffusion facilitator family transporter [Bacillota bacterium]